MILVLMPLFTTLPNPKVGITLHILARLADGQSSQTFLMRCRKDVLALWFIKSSPSK